MSNKKNRNKAPEVDINLFIFSNDPAEPGTIELLKMFYQGAFENTIGISRCKNINNGKIESLIVGVDKGGGFYPLAKVIDPQEAKTYLAPDGKGGFFDESN